MGMVCVALALRHQLVHRQAHQLIAAVAEHLRHALVGQQDLTLPVDQPHAHGRALKDAPETILAVLQRLLAGAPRTDVDAGGDQVRDTPLLVDRGHLFASREARENFGPTVLNDSGPNVAAAPSCPWEGHSITVTIESGTIAAAHGGTTTLIDFASDRRAPTPTAAPAAASAAMNVNKASASDMVLFLGLKKDEADRIVTNRPYRVKGELVAKNVVPKETFDMIKDRISVSP
mgnify:CR=1 FL=1